MTRAFFFNFMYLGHIYPTLPLVRELQSRGVEVTVYGLEDHRSLIEGSGLAFRPYGSSPKQEFNAMQLAAYLTEWILELLPGILRDVEGEQPDFIITDSMLPLGWYVARISNLPLVVSTTHYVANEAVTSSLGIGEFLRQGDEGTYNDDLAVYLQGAKRLQAQFRIAPLSARDTFQVPGDLTIVTTSRELQPASNRLDESFKFVGPILDARGDAPAFPFEFIDGHTAVYISLGTMASNSAFFETCIEAFSNAPYRVVISTGGKEVSLPELPANILLRSFVPQLDLLQRIDVFVTHGGWNSINEALYYDVPVVVCPQGKDQFSNAEIIEGLGAGKKLLEITPAGLRTAVDDVFADETYGQNIVAIGQSLRAAGGAARAAAEILTLVNDDAQM